MSKRRISREKRERRNKIFGLFALIVVLSVFSYFLFVPPEESCSETVQTQPPTEIASVTDNLNEQIEMEQQELEMISYIEAFYLKNNDTVVI